MQPFISFAFFVRADDASHRPLLVRSFTPMIELRLPFLASTVYVAGLT